MASRNFRNYWNEHGLNEETSSQQLDLLGEEAIVAHDRERLTGAQVYARFVQALIDNGLPQDQIRQVVALETQALFGLSVAELYATCNGRRGDRSTLPMIAQLAYCLSEGCSLIELERILGGLHLYDPVEITQYLAHLVTQRASEARGMLPW